MGIGRKIRELRCSRGLTQSQLARMIGVTPAAVGNYEQEVSHPKEEVLYRLFEALSCEPNELFGDIAKTSAARRAEFPAEKYLHLDDKGKKRVDDCIEEEFLRCAEGEQTACCEVVKIAARKGSAVGRTLKKRDPARSITEEPDYGDNK